jgi:hypothetical protein
VKYLKLIKEENKNIHSYFLSSWKLNWEKSANINEGIVFIYDAFSFKRIFQEFLVDCEIERLERVSSNMFPIITIFNTFDNLLIQRKKLIWIGNFQESISSWQNINKKLFIKIQSKQNSAKERKKANMKIWKSNFDLFHEFLMNQ